MANYEPRHVYVVSFDDANTDLYYFCSHDDIILDGVASANIFRGVLINPSTVSQSLNPIRANATIGNISFSFLDESQTLTALLNTKLTSSPSQGLRGKRIQHWVGEKGSEWSSGYRLVQTQQFYQSIGWADGAYTFNAQDIQRSELEDIFDVKKTTLSSTVSLTDSIINVNSAAAFELVQHGGAYTDAPNESVGYIKIQDEIIRYTAKTSTTFTVDNTSSTLSASAAVNANTLSITNHTNFESAGYGYVAVGSPEVYYPIKWTGKTDSPHQLTGVTGVTVAMGSGSTVVNLTGRGVLGSRIAEHTVDSNQPIDKRTKVEEYIYIEMPAVQMLYAVLTGTIYNSSPASTFPDHWNLGISAADWVATSEFLTIGDDLWDTTDDTQGFILRFEGLTKTNAKKFIEEQILLIAGLYTPVLRTGELGLRRMSGVISDSAYSRILNETNIIKIDSIRYDLDDIHNSFLVKWNYNAISKEYTREVLLSDTASINRWNKARDLEIKSLGLKGSIHTDSIIGNFFNIWRDRYAGPPFKATIQLNYSQRNIQIGDIARLQLQNVPEFTDQNAGYSSLDISVEVQKLTINYRTGVITVDVFGSTNRASPLVIGNPSLDDTFYTSQGSDISSYTTGSGTTTWTITGNSSLTGVTDLNSSTATTDNGQGIFYYNGNITINAGVTVTISNNVEIRCKGTFTNNGTINGIGNGISASTEGTAGYIGQTKSDAGFTFMQMMSDPLTYLYFHSDYDAPSTSPETSRNKTRSRVATGSVSTIGPYNIVNNDTSITGKPGDLRGTSGGSGGNVYQEPPYVTGTLRATGAAGGDGGAGLILICRGAAGGSNSEINLSGADGSVGGLHSLGYFIAGSGAGGYPGGFVIILDGDTVTETISPYFVADLGNCPSGGIPAQLSPATFIGFPGGGIAPEGSWQNNGYFYPGFEQPMHSTELGYSSESKAYSNLWVTYLTESQTAGEDTPSECSLPTAISVAEQSNTQNSVNVLGLEISATAPSDTNYKAARIYIKKQSTQGYMYAGEVTSGQEVVFWVAADGSTYDIKAHSVSITNIESTDYIERTFTVSNGITTELGTGSTIISGANITTSGGLLISGTDLLVYDSDGNVTQRIDLSGTGNFTGIGTTSGSAADEQLVPNNFFNFYTPNTDSPQLNIPDGWYITYVTGGSSPSSQYVTYHVLEDSPNVEGGYLRIEHNASIATLYITSKTFKVIPGQKYRIRVRARNNSTASPSLDDGIGLIYHLSYTFKEPLGVDNDDTTASWLESDGTIFNNAFSTFETDWTCPAGYYWCSFTLNKTSAVAFDVDFAWVEVIPWGVLSKTDIGIFINDTTFGNQGIQLDYNSGTPRAYVGDGNKKYLQFDGTDLSIGEEGGILGVSSYPDDTVYIEVPFWWATDGLNTSITGSGTTSVANGLLYIDNTTTNNNSIRVSFATAGSLTTDIDWSKNRKFKAWLNYGNFDSTTQAYLVSGLQTGNSIGFYYASSQWYAFSRNNTSSTSTVITSSPLPAPQDIFEAQWNATDSPQNVTFYINGSLVATHTTNLPSGTTWDLYFLTGYLFNNGTPSSAPYLRIGNFKILAGY